MTATQECINLESSDIRDASYMLNKLFAHYPLHVGFFPNETRREKKSRLFLEFALRYSIHYGIAQAISPKLEGIALWLPPTMNNINLGRVIRSGTVAIWAQLSIDFLRTILPIGNHLESIRARVANSPHWYLFYIGVTPEFQGKHYSTRLLDTMLPVIDETQKPCYLETHTEKNVKIFQKFGFSVIEKSTIPKTQITNWAMLRKSKQT